MSLQYNVYVQLNIVTLRRVLSLTHHLEGLSRDHLLWKHHVRAVVRPRHLDSIIESITDPNPWRYYALHYSPRRTTKLYEVSENARLHKMNITNWAYLQGGFSDLRAITNRSYSHEDEDRGMKYYLLSLSGNIYRYQYNYDTLTLEAVVATGVARLGNGDRVLYINRDGTFDTILPYRYVHITDQLAKHEGGRHLLKERVVDGSIVGDNLALVTDDGALVLVDGAGDVVHRPRVWIPTLKVVRVSSSQVYALGIDGSLRLYTVGEDNSSTIPPMLTSSRLELPRVLDTSNITRGSRGWTLVLLTEHPTKNDLLRRLLYAVGSGNPPSLWLPDGYDYQETPVPTNWPVSHSPTRIVAGLHYSALIDASGITIYDGKRHIPGEICSAVITLHHIFVLAY